MTRSPLPSITSSRIGILLVVASLVIAMLFDVEDFYSSSMTSDPGAGQARLISLGASSPSTAPVDSMSLLQGANIHIDLLGARANEKASSSASSEKQHAKDDDDASLFGGVPTVSKSTRKVPDVALVSMSGSQGMASEAASQIAAAASSWRSSLRRTIKQRLATASTGGIAAVMLVLLIGCTCMAAVTIVYPNKFPWPWSGGRQGNAPEAPQQTIFEDRHEYSNGLQRGSMLSRGPPSVDDLADPRSQQKAPGTGPWGSALSPFASPLVHSPPLALDQLQQSFEDLAPLQERLPKPQDSSLPPPLCPTLVMPVCEARFGVPMYELAQLNTEGDLNIIGLSGNPLLRAVVRKIGTARTLEISMPEQNSAPRATITPSTTEIAGHGQQGCRALEIRGMRGVLYGILEMRSSGACYVVRDGQTVLTIDGDADSLQLSIKSCTGIQLASVRCSAEPFGGVDHVEVRVEPGVDTVLVLAVVLAVLLLSPYLAPVDH